MGVASMSFTRLIPSASTAFTWSGSFLPSIHAERAGTRLSRTNVVFPEPETPVTAVSLPLGILISKGFTVWIAPVERRISP